MTRRSAVPAAHLFAVAIVLLSPVATHGQFGIHPRFSLRDSTGKSVIDSGNPLSLQRSCSCHDISFIGSHTAHAGAWQSRFLSAAALASSRPRETNALKPPELNCLLCHMPNPSDGQWMAAIRDGNPEWAATATLANTALVERRGDRWRWNADAFLAGGTVGGAQLRLANPSIENCALCHGIAGSGLDEPVVLGGLLGPGSMRTLRTGEIISPQRIANSGINLRGKQTLARSWDIHAERLLDCTDCHHSVNNPAYCREADQNQPEGLKFDGRRVPLEVYLRQPNHNLAGQSGSGGGVEARISCRKCHDPAPTHEWLPYAERHLARLSCQSCHAPKLYSVAVESVDWTTLAADGTPRVTYRGADTGSAIAFDNLVDGFEPVLLMSTDADGRRRLAPHNLVTSWYWVAGNPERPIPIDSLVAAFERGNPGNAESLVAAGFESPRIVGEVMPYAVNHGITGTGWAARDCRSCHRTDSRISQSIVLSRSFPGEVIPVAPAGSGAELAGDIRVDETGQLVYEPESGAAGLYVLGHDSSRWANIIGLMTVAAVLLGAITHALLRWRAARRHTRAPAPHTNEVYMYTVYERFWHWLQALAITILLVTGLEIHFSAFELLGFAMAVRVHNIVAFVVVANAVFAALYHLASGEIRQYLPEPAGFFNHGIAQARYYLSGIFHGHAHPFEKRPDKKLNPLQQITYLSILNVLLPVQIVTGMLIWGAQRWVAVDEVLGGLSLLAPIHALGAWLFAAFLLLHVYLTTTGPTPTANIRAMIHGWERTDSRQRMERS